MFIVTSQLGPRLVLLLFPDPASNQELGTVPEMGLAETEEAIAAAAKAFPAWSTTTAKVSPSYTPSRGHPHPESIHQERHDILMKMYALMQQHHDDLGRLIVGIFMIKH